MRCTNCGLPLSPARTIANCPRCGAPLNAGQGVQQLPFESGGWGNMGGMPQENPWGQAGPSSPPNPFAPQGAQNPMGMGQARTTGVGAPSTPEFRQSPLAPRRPYSPPPSKNSRNLFMIAGLCVIFGALLLVLVLALGSGVLGNNSPTTGNSNPTASSGSQQTPAPTTAATPAETPATEATPEATGTVYPAQQYIDNAQMATGVDKQTMQPQQPTTTFKAGSTMYVTFQLHPPSTGGAVCTYWYLKGNSDPITSFSSAVKPSSRASYTYAIYGNAGDAYVELYWASDKSCADKTLAQHVDFTVTA